MLQGAVVIASSDHASSSAADKLGESAPGDPTCVADAYGGFELAADVSPDPGEEAVLASYAHGVVVLGADGHQIAAAPGFGCSGSQDGLIGLEILKSSQDAPVIAVAVVQGGRRVSTTSLHLFAVGSSRRLVGLFTGDVEQVDGAGTASGGVTLVPGGLIYRHPTSAVALWRYDRGAGRYVDPGPRHD